MFVVEWHAPTEYPQSVRKLDGVQLSGRLWVTIRYKGKVCVVEGHAEFGKNHPPIFWAARETLIWGALDVIAWAPWCVPAPAELL